MLPENYKSGQDKLSLLAQKMHQGPTSSRFGNTGHEFANVLMMFFEVETRSGKAWITIGQTSHLRDSTSDQCLAGLASGYLTHLDQELALMLRKLGHA